MVQSEIEHIYRLISSILGESKQGGFDKDNMQYQFNCPSCKDENDGISDGKYNLEVNLSMGKFHCWKCNIKGPISALIKRYGGKDLLTEYYSLVKQLKEGRLYNIGLYSDDGSLENGYESDYIKLPDTFTKIDLSKCRKKKLVEYLNKRKISQDLIDYYNIGYTTWDEENWQLRDRIIIPSYDINGDLNYWVGRDFSGNPKKMKYWNSNTDKNKIVLHEDKLNFDANIYLVEGAIDCIYYPNTASLMGKVLSKDSELYHSLYEKANASIIICLDGDTTIDETKRIYNLLNRGRLRNKIKYITLGTDELPWKDFGEAYESEMNAGIIKCMRSSKQFSEIELLI